MHSPAAPPRFELPDPNADLASLDAETLRSHLVTARANLASARADSVRNAQKLRKLEESQKKERIERIQRVANECNVLLKTSHARVVAAELRARKAETLVEKRTSELTRLYRTYVSAKCVCACTRKSSAPLWKLQCGCHVHSRCAEKMHDHNKNPTRCPTGHEVSEHFRLSPSSEPSLAKLTSPLSDGEVLTIQYDVDQLTSPTLIVGDDGELTVVQQQEPSVLSDDDDDDDSESEDAAPAPGADAPASPVWDEALIDL